MPRRSSKRSIKKSDFNILDQPALILSTELKPTKSKHKLNVNIHIMNPSDKDAENTVLTIVLHSLAHLVLVPKSGVEFSCCGNTYLFCLGTIKSKKLKKLTIDLKADEKAKKNVKVQLETSVYADGTNVVRSQGVQGRIFGADWFLSFGILSAHQQPLIGFHEYIDGELNGISIPDKLLVCLNSLINDNTSPIYNVFITNKDTDGNPLSSKSEVINSNQQSNIILILEAVCKKISIRYEDVDPQSGKLAEIDVVIT